MASRVRIEPLSDGVRVTLPARRSRHAALGIVALLPVFLLALLSSFVFVQALAGMVRAMPATVAAATFLLVLVFPLAGVIGTLAVEVWLLYGLAGREVVTATPWMLTDTRSVLVFFIRRRWAAMRISGLRLSPMAGGSMEPRFIARRGLLFEVDEERTRSIAEGCTPDEAAEVLGAVQAALSASLVKREAGNDR